MTTERDIIRAATLAEGAAITLREGRGKATVEERLKSIVESKQMLRVALEKLGG